MSCNNFRQHVRPWLRGELSATDASRVEAHVSDCYFCAAVVENENAILEGLRGQYDVPPPSMDFEERVLAAASSTKASGRRHVASSWVSGAVAAALVIGIALGLGMRPEAPKNEPHNVRLAFNSAAAMENVTLTVDLPSHVEVSGYPGYQRLSWNISLDKGENIVNLPLNILFPGEGTLVAHLDNGNQKKTFRTSLSDSDASSISEPVL